MKVCLISYFFPPNNSSGAQRWSKFVKCLSQSGYDVCVLSNVGDGFGGEDVERALEIRKYARVYRMFLPVPHRPPAISESSWKNILRFFVIPDSRLPFFLLHFNKFRKVVEMEKPDVLIATAPPYSALMMGRMLAKIFKIPFIADLRDPWLNDPERPNRLAKYVLERWTLKGADAVIVVNDEEIYEEAKRFNERTFILEHTYDPDDYALDPIPHRGEIWVSHIGSLFSSRQRELVEGIKKLLPENFKLRVFGPGTGRILSRKDAFREMVSADVLLMIILSERKKARGSSVKLYDYLGVNKPVVVVSEKPFVVKKARYMGLTVASADPESVVKAVLLSFEKNRVPKSYRLFYRLDVACCALKDIIRKVSTRNS